MLGKKQKHQTPVRLVKGVFVPSKPAGQGESRQWSQWLYQPWSQLWINPSSRIGPVSVQSTVLLIGTLDLKQNNELVCLPLERF